MKRACALVLAIACALPAAGRRGEAAPDRPERRKRLSREETIELFRKLHAAAPNSKTFQARLTRTEESALLVDPEPRKYHGEVKLVRPDRLRQEIGAPRRSLTIATGTDVWVYFPEEREVQHIDLKKGIKGREDTKSKSIMPWLTFDFDGLDRKFNIEAARLPTPEGLVVRKVSAALRRAQDGGTELVEGAAAEERAEDAGEEGAEEGVGEAPAAVPVALSSPYVYEITFEPERAEYAPNMIQLVLTVYGEEPWPLRIEQESEDDLVVTEFSEVLLDAPIPEEAFRFKPPRGTKVVELSR